MDTIISSLGTDWLILFRRSRVSLILQIQIFLPLMTPAASFFPFSRSRDYRLFFPSPKSSPRPQTPVSERTAVASLECSK